MLDMLLVKGFIQIYKNILFDLKQLRSGLEVIKLFSSSAQLSMKFQLLINVEVVDISANSGSVLNN